MSRCFDIGCMQCKEKLWIGQHDYIYTGHTEIMKQLSDFLYKHVGHTLRFDEDQILDCLDDFKDLTRYDDEPSESAPDVQR